ncbi:MAG: membrane protein insertion efficiency factor YidD [Deltaproteobacteria bacterium]|nr:membrane protein insertion efficiency factor YidD [Deltaproteobacteria bacterium]
MRLFKPLFYIYRLLISPAIQTAFDVHCRFEESCSNYMERALLEHGVLKGTALGVKRILSCSRWSGHG